MKFDVIDADFATISLSHEQADAITVAALRFLRKNLHEEDFVPHCSNPSALYDAVDFVLGYFGGSEEPTDGALGFSLTLRNCEVENIVLATLKELRNDVKDSLKRHETLGHWMHKEDYAYNKKLKKEMKKVIKFIQSVQDHYESESQVKEE